jgi:hypothetical protein
MLCTAVPSGISDSGSALPVRMSEPGPDVIVSPTRDPSGAGCSASRRPAYVTSAMRDERFGSYSIVVTGSPGTPCLLRLKSMMRYWRLWPPPRRRMAMWP